MEAAKRWEEAAKQGVLYFSESQNQVLNHMLEQVRGKRHLDLGSGARAIPGTVSADRSHTALRTNPSKRKVQLDLESRLPFADASFDSISLISVLPYIHNADQLLEETKRILAPDGQLIIIGNNKLVDTSLTVREHSRDIASELHGYNAHVVDINNFHGRADYYMIIAMPDGTPKPRWEPLNHPQGAIDAFITHEIATQRELAEKLPEIPITYSADETLMEIEEVIDAMKKDGAGLVSVYINPEDIPGFYMRTERDPHPPLIVVVDSEWEARAKQDFGWYGTQEIGMAGFGGSFFEETGSAKVQVHASSDAPSWSKKSLVDFFSLYPVNGDAQVRMLGAGIFYEEADGSRAMQPPSCYAGWARRLYGNWQGKRAINEAIRKAPQLDPTDIVNHISVPIPEHNYSEDLYEWMHIQCWKAPTVFNDGKIQQ